MDATTIRVREPRELLALLPYQLGFMPHRSAVAVALRPPRGRVGLVARVDLPDLADPELGPQLARRLVTHLVGDGADRAVLAVYTDADPRPWAGRSLGPGPWSADPGTGGPRLPAEGARAQPVVHRAVEHFRAAADLFLGEVPVWVVGPDGYLSLDCSDPGCCPPGGRPLVDLESTAVGAHMVLAGAMVADSREMLVPEPSAAGPARRNAVRASRRARMRREAAVVSGDAALAQWRAAALRAWRDEVAAARDGVRAVRPAVLGRLACALSDVAVRDAVLLSAVPGAGDLPERSLGPRAPGEPDLASRVADVLGALLSPRDGVPPDADLHAASSTVLHRVAAHQPACDRAPALALLGVLAWWGGDGARAGVLVDRALRADPDHRLALLMRDALGAGLAPGWVRQQP